MVTTTGAFFIGVGTTFAIVAAGFGGGLVLSKAAFGPTPTAITKSVAELPPVRAVVPTSAEAATPKEEPVAATPPVQSAPTPLTPLPEGKQTAEEEKEKGKQADVFLQANDILYVPFSWMKHIAVDTGSIAASTAGAAIYAVH